MVEWKDVLNRKIMCVRLYENQAEAQTDWRWVGGCERGRIEDCIGFEGREG